MTTESTPEPKPTTVYVRQTDGDITINDRGLETYTWQVKGGRVQVDAEDVDMFLAAVEGASLTKE